MIAWSMSHLRKLTTLLQVNYAYMLEYRGEIFFWMIATILPLIMMGPWMELGAGGRFPLDRAGFARYFIAAFIVRQFSITWVIYEFEHAVISGRLSPWLLAPYDPGLRYASAHLAEHAARLPFVIGMIALALFLLPEALLGADGATRWPDTRALVLAWLAIYAAWLLRFLMQYTLAMGAFWVERIASFDHLLMIPYFAFSGVLAPIDVFPATARELVLWTPFPYLVWFPAGLLAGMDVGVPWHGFAVVSGWIVAVWLLNRVLWRAGLHQYSAMGA